MTLNNLFNGIKLGNSFYGATISRTITGVDNIKAITEQWKNADAPMKGVARSFIEIRKAFDGNFGKGISKTFSVLKDGVSSLVAAHPVLTSIGAIIAGFNVMYAPILDGAKKLEQASKAVGDYQNTVSELESVKQELENINVRMDELNAKGHLTLVESEEIEKLTRSNDELERRKNILETLEKGQFESSKKAIDDYLNDSHLIRGNAEWHWYNPLSWGGNDSMLANYDPLTTDKGSILTPLESINSYLNGIEYLQNKITDLEKQNENTNNTKTIANFNKEIKKWQSVIDDYISVVSTDLDSISTLSDSFNEDYFDSTTYKNLMDLVDRFEIITGNSGKSKESKIEGLLAKTDYEGLRNRLVDLAKQGKLTAETLNNASGDIGKFFSDISAKDISTDELVQYFKAIADPEAYNFENIRKQFKDTLASFNEQGKEFVDGLSEDELTAYMTIKASGIDTSEWDIQTWKNQIEDKLKVEATVDIKATPKLDEFTQAKESDNSGKNYDTIVSSLESVKKLYEGGLVGTDDFLSFAKLISPNDVATVSEYEKYVGNIAKYFTEDYKGLESFKKDLDAKGLAEYNAQTGKLETTFKNTSEAAKEMGMSTETFVMAMQKLDEFGYDIKRVLKI